MVEMMKRMKHEKNDMVEMIGSGFCALEGTRCYCGVFLAGLIDRNELVFPPVVVLCDMQVFLTTLSDLQLRDCLQDIDCWRLFANLNELCLVQHYSASDNEKQITDLITH